jgi:hypothetical protein
LDIVPQGAAWASAPDSGFLSSIAAHGGIVGDTALRIAPRVPCPGCEVIASLDS